MINSVLVKALQELRPDLTFTVDSSYSSMRINGVVFTFPNLNPVGILNDFHMLTKGAQNELAYKIVQKIDVEFSPITEPEQEPEVIIEEPAPIVEPEAPAEQPEVVVEQAPIVLDEPVVPEDVPEEVVPVEEVPAEPVLEGHSTRGRKKKV